MKRKSKEIDGNISFFTDNTHESFFEKPGQDHRQAAASGTGTQIAASGKGGFFVFIKAIIFACFLFLSMTVQTGTVTMCLCAAAFLSLLGRKPMLRFGQRLCVPVLGLLLFAVVYGAAAIYTPFGADGVAELYKFLAAFSLAVILLARYDKEDVPGLLWGGVVVSAAIAVISVDLACYGKLFDVFNGAMRALGADYSEILQDYGSTRVAGIYNDANVTAALFSLGAILSMHLLSQAQQLWKKLPAALLLGINALALFLSTSRGAFLSFGAALLCWLVLAGKGNRLPLFFLMVFSAASTVAVAIPASSHIISGSTLPVLLLLGNGLAIFVLDVLLVGRLASLATAHIRIGSLLAAMLAILCVGYATAAFTVTGPYTFDASAIVIREIDLPAGTYEVVSPLQEDISMEFWVQTPLDYLKNTYEPLYVCTGTAEAFSVPDDVTSLQLRVCAPEGTVVDAVTFSDGRSIQLGYPLLPVFISNRLFQGLSSSYSLRWIYDQDAWKLFLQAPLLGHGLGSTENLYRSVQTFQYESKYAHNHLLQTMSDTGLVGTWFAAMFVLGAAWLCLRALRKKQGSLAAALLAAWVMMNLHSLMEINFSVRGFKCFSYVLLMLPVLLYAEPLLVGETQSVRKQTKVLGIVLTAIYALYLGVFGGLLQSHRAVLKDEGTATSIYEYLDGLQNYVKRDVFDHDQYALDYVANAAVLKDSRYNGNMKRYVKELRNSGVYANCNGLTRYYYLPRHEWDEMFSCSLEGIRQVRSSPDGWNYEMDFYRTEVLPAMGAENIVAFMDGVLALGDALDAMNTEGRLETVELREDNQKFLTLCRSAKEQGLTGEDSYALLSVMAKSGEAAGK